MRKPVDILNIIGIIFEALIFVLFFVGGYVFLSLLGPDSKKDIMELLQTGRLTTTFEGTIEEQAVQIQGLFMAFGIVFIVISALAIASMFIAFFANRVKSKKLYIVQIVLNVIVFNVLLLMAGILGIKEES